MSGSYQDQVIMSKVPGSSEVASSFCAFTRAFMVPMSMISIPARMPTWASWAWKISASLWRLPPVQTNIVVSSGLSGP